MNFTARTLSSMTCSHSLLGGGLRRSIPAEVRSADDVVGFN